MYIFHFLNNLFILRYYDFVNFDLQWNQIIMACWAAENAIYFCKLTLRNAECNCTFFLRF